MTSRLAAELVAAWVRWYTRNLPMVVAARRREEVAADINDQITYERDARTADVRIAFGLVSRMVRGMTADLAWRGNVHTLKGGPMKIFVTGLMVALALAALAFVLDSGLVVLASVAVLGLTGLAVFVLGLRSARDGDFVVPYFTILVGGLTVAAIGCAAIVWGSRDDAPGLILLGAALIASVVIGSLALGVRTAQRT